MYDPHRKSKLTRRRYNPPWSGLQSALYNIIDPAVEFQIHSNAYSIGTSVPIGRYWATIGKEIVFDFPSQFMDIIDASWDEAKSKGNYDDAIYPYTEIEKLSGLIRDYIDCPLDQLLTHEFDDRWGLVPLLRTCDRRIGKRRLAAMLTDPAYEKYRPIIQKRLSYNKNDN